MADKNGPTIVGVTGSLTDALGRFRPEALDLRGARPLILAVVEVDAAITWLAPDQMNDQNLETLKASFLRWIDEYKHHRRVGRLSV